MAVTTSKTNKPILPRGADVRPIDSYNRAELYSGKALDFDGVNDYVDGGTLDITAYTQMSMSFYFKAHSTTSDWRLISIRYSGSDDIRIFHATSIGAGKLSFALDDGTPVTFSEDFTKNEWYHVVMTHDGTTLKAYFNGVLVQSAASDFNYSGTDGLFYIGRYTGGTFSYYDGEFSNYKLFNTALTAAQVTDLYNNPEKIVPTGVDNTALKLWLPMQEGAGTTAYNGAPDALGSEEVTNGDFATDSDWNKSSFWTIGSGTSSMPSTSSYLPLYQNDVTIAGNTYVLNFDIISIIGTIKATSINNGAAAGEITLGEYSTTGNKKVIFTADSGREAIAFARVVGFSASCTIDNVSVKELTDFGTISGATWTHGIGAPVAQTSVIDWNKISDGTNEVLIPQGLTSGRDLLGNLFENVRKQGALNLDGKSWAEVHDNESLDFGTGDFTLEAWAKLQYTNTGSSVNAILSIGTTSALTLIGMNNPSSIVALVNGTGAYEVATIGDWAHIVLTKEGISCKLYVDATNTDTFTKSANITNAVNKHIGSDSSTIRYYKDQIAQPRIYNRALTASEVLNNYNVTKTQFE